MQFDTKVLYHHKKIVVESILDGFKKLGGVNTESFMWEFPTFITPQILEEIIHNTCFVCGGLMSDGQALDNTWVGSEDFGDDYGQPGTTMSKIGQPIMRVVRKCSSCGHSHT